MQGRQEASGSVRAGENGGVSQGVALSWDLLALQASPQANARLGIGFQRAVSSSRLS